MTQLAFVAPLFLSSSSRAPSFRRPRAPRLTLSPPPTRSAPPSPPRLHPLLSHANRVTVSTVVAAVDRVYSAPGDAYRRFYTLEVLARIPFFAYTCLLHLRETLRGPSDAGTRRLRAHFEQADNEALHLAVMVAMGGGDSPAVAFHFNELIEIHAYDTYDKYISENGDTLENVDAVPLIAKDYYEAEVPPRPITSMRDVLVAIRDDERHHSNQLAEFGDEALSKRNQF